MAPIPMRCLAGKQFIEDMINLNKNQAMSKAKNNVIEQLKAEIMAQSEGQEEIIEFSFQGIQFEKFTPEINALFTKYNKLISLEFSQSGLKTLEGFPKLGELMKLCLEENELDDKALRYICDNFKKLQFLSLSSNKITQLATLKDLSKLNELIQLDLQENPVSSQEGYRDLLFKTCPKLEILDNKDQEGVEVQYSDDDEEEDEDDEFDDDGADLDEDATDEDEEYSEDEDEEDEPQPKKKIKK